MHILLSHSYIIYTVKALCTKKVYLHILWKMQNGMHAGVISSVLSLINIPKLKSYSTKTSKYISKKENDGGLHGIKLTF